MAADATRWVARLSAAGEGGVRDLLRLPLALDVWERCGEVLVVAASEATLGELERRRLATVERLCTVPEYEARAQGNAGPRKP